MPENEMREKLKAMSDEELDRYGKATIEYAKTLDPGTPKMEMTGELLRMIREEVARRTDAVDVGISVQSDRNPKPIQVGTAKPKKKKRGCLSAILVIVFGILAVCIIGAMLGKDEKPVSTRPSQSTFGENQTEDQNGSDAPAASEESEGSPSAALNNTVIYDKNDIKITATGVSIGSLWNVEIKFLVENNSEKNIAFSGDDAIINGITVPCWLYIDVAAGKKSNGSMSIAAENIRTAGIKDIATVVCKETHIADTDSFKTLYDVPFSLETSISETYKQEINNSGDVIFEKNGVTLIAQVVSNEFYGKSVQIFAKNEAGKDVIVEAENISVNGFTISGWMYDRVYDGTVRFCGLDVFATGLKENEIEEIEDVTFTIRVIDANSFSEIAVSDEIQIFVN